MLCKEILKEIEKTYGRDYACSWDNVGLLVGRDDKEVSRIYIALDATDEVVEACVEQKIDLLITHHPLIFSGMKRINNQDFVGRRVLSLARNDISYYAMHTNYDVAGMADLCANLLGWKQCEVLEETGKNADEEAVGIGKVANFSEEMTLRELCEQVKEVFSLSKVTVYGDLTKKIHRAAICPGSGKSLIKEAIAKQADVLITGDIGHHEGIDAVACNLAVIDAGHYGIEYVFQNDMKQFLEDKYPALTVKEAPITSPFVVI